MSNNFKTTLTIGQNLPRNRRSNGIKPTIMTQQDQHKPCPNHTANTQTPSPSVNTSSPPLLFMDIDQWEVTPRQIMYSCPDGTVTTKLINNQIKIIANFIITYRQIQKILQDNKTSYHTYALPEEKTLKIRLKGIPSFIDKQVVKEELPTIGYLVTHVRHFLKDGRRLPMYVVSPYSTITSTRKFST